MIASVASASSFVRGASRRGERLAHPGFKVLIQQQPALLAENQNFPDADRRDPNLISRVAQKFGHPARQALRLQQALQPDVSIEHQLHGRSTSQSFSSLAGETMPPTLRPESAMEPTQLTGLWGAAGGETAAMGLPKRMTRMGCRVCGAVPATDFPGTHHARV